MSTDDADRIWDAIDGQRKETANVALQLAVMSEQLKGMREGIRSYRQPCEAFVEHVRQHTEQEQEARKTWRDVALEIIRPAITIAFGVLLGYLGIKGVAI